MLSYIISIIDVSSILFIISLTLLFKFIMDKCSLDPRFRKIDAQVPGPFPLPIFGNSLSFILAGKNGQSDLQAKFIKKYGRLYRTWIGNQFVVQLSHPEDLEAVFMNNKTLGKGQLTWPFKNCLGGLFNHLSASHWRMNRKRLQPFFTKDVIKQLTPDMNRSIYKVIEKLKKHVDGPEFDITDTIYDLSLDFITKTAYDFEISENEKLATEVKTKFESIIDVLSMQMFLPFLTTGIFGFLLNKIRVIPAKKYFLNIVKMIISKKISDIENKTYNSDQGPFSSGLLFSSYQNAKQNEDENFMLEEILSIILGGGESSMRTITFSLLMIAMRPNLQEKVYQEIYEVFGDDDRQADLYDCDRLPYLDQIIKETLRRFTLLPMIFRKADCDIKIGPYVFPPETQFMINIGGIHLNPEFYPKPYEFNPDNFTPEAIKKRHRYSFIPFAAGSRNCIGKHVAELEIKLALIAILRTFSVHTTKKMEDLNLSIGLILRNIDGILLNLKLRKPPIQKM